MVEPKRQTRELLNIPQSPCGRCTRRQCFGTSCDPFDKRFRRAWRGVRKFYGEGRDR